MSAFLSFCDCIKEEGKFPELTDRKGLRRLLAHFTFCKAVAKRRWYFSRREQHLGEEPHTLVCPEVPQEFGDEVAALLNKLPEELREIARLCIEEEDLTREQIANRCGCGVATLFRRLAVIRSYWRADWEDLMGGRLEAEGGCQC
jgi:DNA-directed RNA polymerase specialized sigma24 family protein